MLNGGLNDDQLKQIEELSEYPIFNNIIEIMES